MKKILNGKSIVVTRAENQAKDFIEKLEALGAEVIFCPTISIFPIINSETEYIYNQIEDYQWIIFTSTNSIKIFFEIFDKLKINRSILKDTKFATVGEKTSKKLSEYNFKSSLMPKTFTADYLLEEFKTIDIINKNILIPCSKIARKDLSEGLKKLGANSRFFAIYETIKPEVERLEIEKITNSDYITFTSPSTVENFYQIYFELLKNFKAEIVCIGSITEKKVRELIKKESIVPDNFTIEGMIEQIIKRETDLIKNQSL